MLGSVNIDLKLQTNIDNVIQPVNNIITSKHSELKKITMSNFKKKKEEFEHPNIFGVKLKKGKILKDYQIENRKMDVRKRKKTRFTVSGEV